MKEGAEGKETAITRRRYFDPRSVTTVILTLHGETGFRYRAVFKPPTRK